MSKASDIPSDVSVDWPTAPFQVNPNLVRDILAAVAFLIAEDVPEAVYERLNAPSPPMLRALNELVGIRQEMRP